MPNWEDILREINSTNSAIDNTRRKYTNELSAHTGRNVIIYYSGWMQYPPPAASTLFITDDDRNGFMQMFHRMDKKKGLDLILHTPGGGIAATEALINYMRKMFKAKDIRAFVPHTCMSGGTLIALSCSEILMGKHSSIGPIDPQINGLGATSFLAEFVRIGNEISQNPERINLWGHILNKIHPTMISECERAIEWAKNIARDSLKSGMCHSKGESEIEKIISGLVDYENTQNHGQQIDIDKAKKLGINVTKLEEDQNLQDLVLTIHHCCMHTFSQTPCVKIIENNIGASYLHLTNPFNQNVA